MRNCSFLLVTLSAAVLSACANLGGITPQATLIDANQLAASSSIKGSQNKDAIWPASNWWLMFGDVQLDHLIEEALKNSPNLRLAKARYERSLAMAGIVEASRYPQVEGNAVSNYQRFSKYGEVPPAFAGSWQSYGRLGLDFNYEFDFWNRNEAAFEAALGQAKVSEAEEQQAKLLLSVAITRTYIQLQQEFEHQDITEALVQKNEKIRNLVQQRYKAGLDSRAELEQASAAIEVANAELEAVHEHIVLLRHQIAALLGAGPDRADAIARPAVDLKASIGLPTTLPAELIGRRPDVVARRWQVESAAHEIDVAKSQFYPNINLAAFVGQESIGLGNLFKGGSRIAGVGPAINLPIFEGGRLRSQLAAQDAEYDAAVEQYNATLVDSLRDVADQLSSQRMIEAQLESARAALARYDEAYRLAELRYSKGLSNYLAVLTVQGQVLTQRQQVIDLEARKREIIVELIRALGGGYKPNGATPPSATRLTTHTPAA